MDSIVGSIKRVLRPAWSIIKSYPRDIEAEKKLGIMAKKARRAEGALKVGFLVFEPETWDKQQPVYEEMVKDPRFAPEIVVVPSFNQGFSVGNEYGHELEFFQSTCEKVVKAFDQGEWIDLRSRGYDYLFYQDPYMDHYPEPLRCDKTIDYTRICYLPYGYTTLKNFCDLVRDNREFFRCVYAYFPEIRMNQGIVEKRYRKAIQKGVRHVIEAGYPSFESFLDMKDAPNLHHIAWTPRWSYDAKVGGSHFLEYKDAFLELHSGNDLVLRPHPMLFTNLVKTGTLSEEEAQGYRARAAEYHVEISEGGPIEDVLKWTGILITDISSVIPAFFLTGKPIIYCDSFLEPCEEFVEMLEGIYVAHSWEEVLKYLSEIQSGNDYLSEKRAEIIRKHEKMHRGSAKRITEWIAKDAGC